MRWPSTRIICSWLWEQYWLARRPGFLAATLAELRSIIGPEGQREVLLAELSSLTIPTLIIWGAAVQCERFKHNEHGNCHSGAQNIEELYRGCPAVKKRAIQAAECAHQQFSCG